MPPTQIVTVSIPTIWLTIAYFASCIVFISAWAASPPRLRRLTIIPHTITTISALIVTVFYAGFETFQDYSAFMLRGALLLYIVSNILFTLTIYAHLGITIAGGVRAALGKVIRRWTSRSGST